MTTPTQAQIEAAANVIDWILGPHLREIETDVTKGMTAQTINGIAAAALTAAAQVGETSDERAIRYGMQKGGALYKAVIERCEQVASDYYGHGKAAMLRHLRKLKDAAQAGERVGPAAQELAKQKDAYEKGKLDGEAATIERCKQVVKELTATTTFWRSDLIAALDKLKDEP